MDDHLNEVCWSSPLWRLPDPHTQTPVGRSGLSDLKKIKKGVTLTRRIPANQELHNNKISKRKR